MVDNMWNRLNGDEEGTSILENGWIRVNSANVVDEYRHYVFINYLSSLAWLAQANHIFDSLGKRFDLDHYVFVDGMQCWLSLLGPIDNLPPGYLFLCPLTEIQTELPGHFQIPACAAYWSRDPSGAERLSAEEARNAGFPDIEFLMWADGSSWDDGVYIGIGQFHEAKGFEPYSQEIAREVGYPLFEVSCERDALFATVAGIDEDDEQTECLSTVIFPTLGPSKTRNPGLFMGLKASSRKMRKLLQVSKKLIQGAMRRGARSSYVIG
ncbi:hypothetical protein B0H19DRAFT_1187853 [Mycena capillaripes]|nr:hypothetical protein B0H19DRAFT_1187853 [Mycena capillaripes]